MTSLTPKIQREENEDPMPGKSHVGQSESNSALNYHCRFCHVMLRSPDFKGHLLLVAITLLFTSFSLPSSLPFPKGSPHSSSDSNIISVVIINSSHMHHACLHRLLISNEIRTLNTPYSIKARTTFPKV